MYNNTIGSYNTATGVAALYYNTTGNYNVASGLNALYGNTTGQWNVGIGNNALSGCTTGERNSSLGVNALYELVTYVNCSGIGHNSAVSASNQVQLGDSATTTYAYGAVQARSDIRDKADVQDTVLGLEFVNALRPVDYKWDMRESYRTEAPAIVNKPFEPTAPVAPVEPAPDASDSEKEKYERDLESFTLKLEEYDEKLAAYNASLPAYEAYLIEKDEWLESNKLGNITHDGTHKRSRFHHGLIAQEVQSLIAETGIDFGGFQDHSVKGGDDVLSIGYEELIGPMIKAIQQLSAKVAELENPTA
jgi:hypothetical protein